VTTIAALGTAVVPAARAVAGTNTPSPQAAFYTWQAPGGQATAGARVISLTFDDGPGPYTPQFLSVLEQYHVPATFFEIGENVAAHPAWTKEVAAAGYPVEDHTWNHVDLTTIPPSDYGFEIDQTQAEIHSVTGLTPNCVRPPYDAFNSTVVGQLAQRGLTTMSYSIDPKDWTDPGSGVIAQRVISAAFPGAVVDMHDGGQDAQTLAALPQIINSLRAEGYSFVSICGALGSASGPVRYQSAVVSEGQAPAAGPAVISNYPLVGAAVTSAGYWLVGSDGGIFTSGGAGFYGSTGAMHLNQSIVAMAPTPSGQGYWLVASDGGIFTFGNARYHGSTGAMHLNQPIVGMAATPDGGGYWLVASDGGIFTFGNAHYHGSTGAVHLNQPIVGMASDARSGGYWLAARDGGVFAFDAPYFGSAAGGPAARTFYAIAAPPGYGGYILAGSTPVH
jgi:peptidoglycan/xylan/chitin deacetylase (PgdA/CDA1 family)